MCKARRGLGSRYECTSSRGSLLLEVAPIQQVGELADVLLSRCLPLQGQKHLLGQASWVQIERVALGWSWDGGVSDEIWVPDWVLAGHEVGLSLDGLRLMMAEEALGGLILGWLLVE